MDAQLRKCRGHQAHSGWEGTTGQGCGSEVVSWDFHGAPASSTLSSEVPQLETGEAGRWAGGRGAPVTGPPPGGGQRGPGQTQGKQARGAVAAGTRARGTLGHTVSPESGGKAAPQGLECVWQRVQGGTGQPRGARGQAEPQKWDSGPGCRDPWRVLLVPGGTGGCRGNSRAEVGVVRGDGERAGCFGGNVRWSCSTGSQTSREGRSQDES